MLYNEKREVKSLMNSKTLKELIEKVGYTEDWRVFNLRLKGDIKDSNVILSLWFSYKIARYTQVFTDEVREFLFENRSYRELYNKYNIGEGVIKNNIYRQVKKYYEIIGRDLYKDYEDGLIDESESLSYANYLESKYNELDKTSKRIEDYFYEDFFSGANVGRDFRSISNEQFIEARDKISRLSIEVNQFLLSNLDDGLVDYIAYLLTTSNNRLLAVDLERKENLKFFLKLEEYFNKENDK